MQSLLTAAAVLAVLAAAPAYKAPPETAALAPGEGAELTTAACAGCHSLDYITTQPRPLVDPQAFWTAEVAKMQTAYGAQLKPEDAKAIAAYLARAYD